MIDVSTMTRLFEPVLRRINALLCRGVVVGVDDGKKMQTVKVRVGRDSRGNPKLLEGVEHFQPYGLSAVPGDNAETVIGSLNGNRDHAIALVVDDRNHRPTGHAKGEVCLYSKFGQKVHLRADGSLLIQAGTTQIEIAGDEVNVTAGTKLTLSAGASSIELEASGLTITTPSGVSTFQ